MPIYSFVIDAVEKRHSTNFRRSLLGAAINTKLNMLRKNEQKTRKYEERKEEKEKEQEQGERSD